MRSINKNADFFDDNFEVTYEDDLSLNSESYTQPLPNSYRDFSDFEVDEDYEYYHDDYDEDEDSYISDYKNTSYRNSIKKRRPRRSIPRIAAPIQKGGSTVVKLTRTLMRNLSILLMLAIIIFMGYNFLRGSAPYGDIENAISTNTYTQMLAAYFSIAALLIFYEIISILWSMTRVRVRDKYGSHKEDVGRGLFSFIFLFLCSYAAFIAYRWVPESHEILKGLKGVLDVFGSMHNALFGLCFAGVISCLVRKYSITL